MQKEKLDLILSIISVSVFVLLLIIAGLLLFRIYLKRKNKLLEEKEKMSIRFEQTLLQSKLEIQEQTFADISREIHDNIGQVLSLARINLNTINSTGDNVKVNLVDELMEKAITDLRNLSHSLDADLIRKKGWPEVTRKLLRDLERSGKYSVNTYIAEGLPALGNEKPIILFRMIQEVINNIIKHAGASKIILEANNEEGQVLIRIRDNGKGFDQKANGNGIGLQNLENRAKMINASVYISSALDSGTNVTIAIKTETNE